MLEDSFTDAAVPAGEVRRATSAGLSRRSRMAMLLLNALPLCHVLAIAVGTVAARGAFARMVIIVGGLYLLPPLLVRLLFWLRPLPAGNHALDTSAFLLWWASAQGQIVFCRFPFLEELLRLVPGLYSAWLRLWGARIGRLTYWAPGVAVLDRSLLEIGDGVIFGAGVRLNSHVIAEDDSGILRLQVAPVKIGDGCRIGGYSLLAAGTVVKGGQTLKAFSLSPPFAVWHEGRRARIAVPQ